MKTLLLFLMIFINIFIAYPQKKEEQYVIVPIKFYKFNKVDIYGLSSGTNRVFTKAGYKVLTANKSLWPKYLINNPCKALYTETKDISPLLGASKVEILIKDCYNKILARGVGKGHDVDGMKEFQKAIKNAFIELQKYNAIEESFQKVHKSSSSSINVIKERNSKSLPMDKVPTVREVLEFQWKRNPAKGIEGFYRSDNSEYKYYILQYKKDVFVLGLAENNKREVLAKIQRTSSPDTYKVIWEDGSHGFGYKKNNKILLENNTQKEIQVVEFEKYKFNGK